MSRTDLDILAALWPDPLTRPLYTVGDVQRDAQAAAERAVHAAVNRLVVKAADYAVRRDRTPANAPESREHWRVAAHNMAAAAHYAADAGLCDMSMALDRDNVAEVSQRVPTAEDYQRELWRAIEGNR